MSIKTPCDMICGFEHSTNNSGTLKVVKYHRAKIVDVEFVDTGYKTTSTSSTIRKGQVKDNLSPSLFGVGFTGVGNNKPYSNGKHSKAYQVWNGMLERCYSPTLHAKFPTYKNCTTCDEWHNFQNFAKWFNENYPKDGGKYHLDKDIKVDGNKLYSPETCLFATREANISKASARNHKFTNPSGRVVDIYNLKTFCEENGLNRQCMQNVEHGWAKSHKGWLKGR